MVASPVPLAAAPATVPTRLRRTARSNSRRSRLPSSAASPARSRRRSMSRPSVAASSSPEGDDDAPELPDYDVVQLGPLETSAVALGARGWLGGSDDANAYVAAIDRGFLLLAAHAPSELALLKEYERYWKLSEAAQLPGARTPRVYAIVEVGAGGSSVADAVQAHALAAGGAEPDLFCFRLAPGADPDAVAASLAAAVQLGACPPVLAVDGYDAEHLRALVKRLEADAPDARVAFDRVTYSLMDWGGDEKKNLLETCAALRVGVVAAEPLGANDAVVELNDPRCDEGRARLLAFLGSVVGGGVQRSPMQVGLNWVVAKGAVPEVETRSGARAWEAGGAMLWRLDENAVGIIDERNAAVERGEGGGGGGGAAPA